MLNRFRRAHTKSRFGCQQCKRRRMKCDLEHPSCGTCVKKGETCSFLITAPAKHLTSASSGLSTSSQEAQCALSIENGCCADGKDRTTIVPSRYNGGHLDAQIGLPLSTDFPNPWKVGQGALSFSLQGVLSHYKLTTSLTIENGHQEIAVWQLSIPQLAADFRFLTHSILSVTSLHIAHLSKTRHQSQQSSYWNSVAASQMNQALPGYRHEIERITQKNAAAVFASSALTAIYMIQTSILDLKDLQASSPCRGSYTDEMASSMMSCLVKTIWGLRGPLEVLIKGWSWIINSTIQPVASRTKWPKMRNPATSRARDEDERLRRIEDLWLQTDRQYDPNSEYLSQALNQLRETYALNSQLLMLEVPRASHAADVLLDRGAIFSWVTRIPREYIQLVEAQDRDALVILAHFTVLLTRTDKVWWLEGLGLSFVTAISIALGSENWKLIEWPAGISGLELHH